MGLCLFLALAEHLALDHIGFLILDDVLMSVDADHRHRVANLLSSRMLERQLIITTHDRSPPNKVLITSREHGFKADYPLNVRGMEAAEARELILQEARRNHCEPLCTDKVIDAIITATDAIPYAMKLVVAHLATGGSPEKVIRDVSARSDILDALFRRSYDSLSPQAQYALLLLGQVDERLADIPLAIVGARRGWRLDGVLEELDRFSLVDLVNEPFGNWVSLPLVTRRFAQKKLIGDDRESLIHEDAKLVRDVRPLSHESPHQAVGYARAVSRLLADIARGTSKEAVERSALLESVLESLAESSPEIWSFIARWRRDVGKKPKLVREAFKRAVEEAPYDSRLWREWAAYETTQGEQLRGIELRLRALEVGGDDVEEASVVAGDVARVISLHAKSLSIDKRRVYLAHLRDLLSTHEATLDATQLSRLAWLYLLEGNVAEARRLAEFGLSKDPENEYCWAIFNKVE